MTNALPNPSSALPPLAFIGGGNMASAVIGGLLQQGISPDRFEVVEPFGPAREALADKFGIHAQAQATPVLSRCGVFIWAVKPQSFAEAAAAVRPFAASAVQISVAAGIPSASIAGWLGNERVVRTMPNTPALIGKGVAGMFARPGVSDADRALVEQVLAPTGELLWVDAENDLDAVTALSGSGPAYVFYFIEAMTEAGREMGLPQETAHRLAVATFTGASALAAGSSEAPSVLRERVTSKGGTTYAAITSMEAAQVKDRIKTAIRAAKLRAGELAAEFGRV